MRLIIAAVVFAMPGAAAATVTGKWMPAGKDSVVEIAPCGGKLCGRVTRLLRPVPGGPPTDRNNPNEALRTRPLVGLPILIDFVPKGREYAGSIYDPRRGRTYRSVIAANPDGTLKVQGCIGPFCQTQTWTRAQ